MAPDQADRPVNGYIELASPQLLDDKWRELCFDLASDQSILQEIVMPETGAGYVYRDAKLVGSATQNRFIYWRTVNDIIELVEISSEVVLDNNQVKIRFVNSPIIEDVKVVEFPSTVVIMIATLNSVHRLTLPHPKTTNSSVLNDLNGELLCTPSNYFVLNNHSNSQHPICSTSWFDKGMVKCALSFPDSSILIIQFGCEIPLISTCEIKQTGIIGRIWSRMPTLLTGNQNDCANAVFVCAPYKHVINDDVLLITLCRDLKIRMFSTSTKECVLTYSLVSQSSFTQSFSTHANPTIEMPMMKLFDSRIVIYLTETNPEFIILTIDYEDSGYFLKDKIDFQPPSCDNMIDFHLTGEKFWVLATARETDSALCYVNLNDSLDRYDSDSTFDAIWDYVSLVDDLDNPSIKNYVSEIFWRGRFSIATVKKALSGIIGHFPHLVENSMEFLEWTAFTRLVDDNQEETWLRFYDYCVQNHHAANKNIGLVVAKDESVISVIKRSNPSFISPLLIDDFVTLQDGPYRGIEFDPSMKNIIESINYISTELLDDNSCKIFEDELFEHPAQISICLEMIVNNLMQNKKIDYSRLNLQHRNSIIPWIESIYEQLDISEQARNYGEMLLAQQPNKLRSDHNPLESNVGIAATFEMFKRLVRARMTLARDLLVFIHIINSYTSVDKMASDKFMKDLCLDLYKSDKVKILTDSLRSYSILVWITETPIKKQNLQKANSDVVNFIANKFQFFKTVTSSRIESPGSSLEFNLSQNLFMNFLLNGGVKLSSPGELKYPQTISGNFYITEIALNLCKLLWPKSNHLCFAEFLFTRRLDDHLDKYLNLSEDWLSVCEHDRHFIRAANCIIHDRASRAVEIFNRLWMSINQSNLLGRFIELDKDQKESRQRDAFCINPKTIYRYYDKLIQLFQLYNNSQCLVDLINHCMSLLDENADSEQQHWINCFRAKLFQYYLELEDPDEAYHTMALTTDQSLRINCLRKFVVSHGEKEQWSTLLSYPFIDIKEDFIDILRQKAESSDLSKLSNQDFYRTSYYDLLFSSYVSDEDFKHAAEIMFSYAQRLAHEVPGVVSIKKQADCLLIALNSLRCVDSKEAMIGSQNEYQKEEGRSSVLKRAYDCESESSFTSPTLNGSNLAMLAIPSKVTCKDLEMKYELTSARLKLLEKDQTANAIALSPLKSEETISQLVASSMFSTAIDLALLFRTPIEPILEGLSAKYIFIMQLSSVDIAMHQDLERDLTDIFSGSYSNIDTYNYIANSSASFVDKLWRLIYHYLVSYDGISHTYSLNTLSSSFPGSTVLMRVVANKLLSAGYDVPASLKSMYLSRNTAELLKLLIKYDKLLDAAELAIEMTDRVLEPSNCFAFTSPYTTNDPPPLYLPTHLIFLLISFLSEDATNIPHLKTSEVLMDKINKYRNFIRSS